ncbi:MAG TPA: SDR family NAD(P)-dependent oxidoreductase [Bryobacteraceae bacterium]|nr:SDR family NAD(P)-dependent oxidoreductase [Bryobacteraceae bacterium]
MAFSPNLQQITFENLTGMRIDGKVVLITGASQGIGAACAAEFARAGARVSLTARSEEGLSKVAPEGSLITAGDLTEDRTRRAIIERTLDYFGAIDILINNAGAGLYSPSWSVPLEEVRWLFDLNLFAPMALTQLAVPHMRERRSGVIVNVGSIAGKMALPWLTVYSASKYALGALTEGMRMELRRDGIRTMIVCPGYVRTAFQQNARGGSPPEAMVRARRLTITAEQCARAIRRGVERDARTVVTPRSGWLLIAAARLFPAFVEARLAALNQTA